MLYLEPFLSALDMSTVFLLCYATSSFYAFFLFFFLPFFLQSHHSVIFHVTPSISSNVNFLHVFPCTCLNKDLFIVNFLWPFDIFHPHISKLSKRLAFNTKYKNMKWWNIESNDENHETHCILGQTFQFKDINIVEERLKKKLNFDVSAV